MGHERDRSMDCRTRRQFLRRGLAGAAGVAAGALPLGWLGTGPTRLRAEEAAPPALPRDLLAVPDRSAAAPTAPVGIVRCRSYDLEPLKTALSQALDLTGGLGTLVGGKPATVKLNTTGDGRKKMCRLPSERTYQVHPRMVEVLCGLFHQAGAKRIVLVESFYENRKPEEILARQGWEVDRILAASGDTAAFADTRNRGGFKDYA